MRAMRVEEFGGPEALRLVEVPTPEPGPGEALVVHRAIGVNFVDTQHRAGTPFPIGLPLVPGIEAAGEVAAVGPGVTEVQVGDRVAYLGMPGVYADAAVTAAAWLVPVPDALSLELAAACLQQGVTAHYLSHSAYPLGPGDVALVHAAAGGVGRLLVQMARRRGARVVAVVSTTAKAAVALADGAEHAVVPVAGAFAAEVRALTGGRGVDVVYDSVGRATFEESLSSLRARGMLVAYGQASGEIPPFRLVDLAGFNRPAGNGSLVVTWTSTSDFTQTPDEMRSRAREVFDAVLDGTLHVEVAGTYPLTDAAAAHARLEARGVTGKLLLVP